MTRPLSAPGSTEDIRARSALVVAPHFDDEVLGCGGLVARLTAAGAVVRVLFLSDGSGAGQAEDPRAHALRRREEAHRALAVLGFEGADHLDLPDGGLDQHLDRIAEAVRSVLLTHRPELLLVPSPLEASADHRAAFGAVHRLFGAVRRSADGSVEDLAAVIRELDVLAYEVNHPFYPDVLVDVSDQQERVAEAMACYESQQELHDYLGARRGLLRFRALTLGPGVEAVEAFRRFRADDFATRGPARLISELGGSPELLAVEEGPTISVIVRTRDRPRLLSQALASLAAGTYRRAEVLVVNDGGETPELPPREDWPLPLRLIDLETRRGRAGAANAGLAAATGDYVAFLDDDDLVEPEHLATLAALVSAAGVRVAYTDAAVGVYDLDGEEGWRLVERRLPYSRDFDPDLLLLDNYIPFNTVLIERRLAEEAGEVDPDLPFFEDWDFLVRLARLAPFHHLARVTCEYRQFRGAGHHILGDRPRERADFLATKQRVLARHAARLTPDLLARVVDRLRAGEVAALEDSRRELDARRRLEERYFDLEDLCHRRNGRIVGLEKHIAVIEDRVRRYKKQYKVERRQHHALDRELARLYERESQLTENLQRESEAHARSAASYGRLEEQHRELAEEHTGLLETHDRLTEHHRDLAEEHRQLLESHDELTTHHRGLAGEHARLLEEQAQLVAAHRQLAERHTDLYGELETAHAQHGDAAERLRIMTEQEARVAAEVRRLRQLIDEMESTRAWRLHQWWQEKKGRRGS